MSCKLFPSYCDGRSDCSDSSDEINCKSVQIDIINYIIQEYFPCVSGYTLCNNFAKHCFPQHEVCVFARDLKGDPLHCPDTEHLRYCEHHQCPHMYKCLRSYCIPIQSICDDVMDCPDGNDEMNCENISCPYALMCRHERKCIHPFEVCDGIVHCLLTGDDESMCDWFDTNCLDGCICQGYAIFCVIVENFQFQKLHKHSSALILHNASFTINFQEITYKYMTYIEFISVIFNRNGYFKGCSLNLPNVEKFVLQRTNLAMLDEEMFKYMYSLKHIMMNENNFRVIKSYTFDMLGNLNILNISFSWLVILEQMCFCNLHTVSILDLSFNNIISLNENVFHCLSTLIILNLTHNSIVSVHRNIFHDLSSSVLLFTDVRLLCCYVHHTSTSCVDELANILSIPEDLCVDILQNDIVLYAATWLIGVMTIGINIIACICNHYITNISVSLLLYNIAFFDILGGVYFVVLGLVNHIYSKDYFFTHAHWPSSIPCQMLNIILILSICGSNFTVLILAAKHIIVVRFQIFGDWLNKIRIISLQMCVWIVSTLIAMTTNCIMSNQSPLCISFHKHGIALNMKDYYMSIMLVVLCSIFTPISVGVVYHTIIQTINASHRKLKSYKAVDLIRIKRRNSLIIVGMLFCGILLSNLVITGLFANMKTKHYNLVMALTVGVIQIVHPVIYSFNLIRKK